MPGTILVADDSPTIQRRASGILEGEGLDVVTVANGVAAIKKLAAIKPLLVLADVSMPGRDGYEVCQIIKQSPETKHVPVLLVFSDLEPYDQARGAQVGADGSVKKPFVQEELVGVVRRITEQIQAATPPPPAMAAPPQPAPSYETAESEPAEEKEPESGFSSIPEGIAFASDVPVLEPEPILHEAEPIQEEHPAEPEPTVAIEPAGTEHYEPPAEVFEAHAPATEQGQPMLVEEPIAPSEETHEHPHPHEHEAIFHAPEVAEPVLADELETARAERFRVEESVVSGEPSAAEPETVKMEEAVAKELPALPEEPPVQEPAAPAAIASAATEVFDTASRPEVAAAEPAGEFAPPQEAELTSPPPANETAVEAAPPAAALDREAVHRIVREVVIKMSPPALPGATIEELAQRLTEEILAGIGH